MLMPRDSNWLWLKPGSGCQVVSQARSPATARMIPTGSGYWLRQIGITAHIPRHKGWVCAWDREPHWHIRKETNFSPRFVHNARIGSFADTTAIRMCVKPREASSESIPRIRLVATPFLQARLILQLNYRIEYYRKTLTSTLPHYRTTALPRYRPGP